MDTWWKTVSEGFQLTERPPEPVGIFNERHKGKAVHLHPISSFRERLMTERPPEPVEIFNKCHKCKAIHLHPISSFGERLNDKFLVLRPPSPHNLFRI